jgi:hypothetical protein
VAKINICESSIRLLKSLWRCQLWNLKVFLKIYEVLHYIWIQSIALVESVTFLKFNYILILPPWETIQNILRVECIFLFFSKFFTCDPYSITFNVLFGSFCNALELYNNLNSKYTSVPNRCACTFISGKVCILTSIEDKRQTLTEINVHARLFGHSKLRCFYLSSQIVKKLLHPNRLFWGLGIDNFKVWRKLKDMFPELFKRTGNSTGAKIE